MRHWLTAVFAIGICGIAVPAAPAGFVFTFSNVADMMPNTTNTVNVFLHWDHTGSNTLASPGLSEADFGLRLLTSSPGSVTIANPTGSSVTPNTDFDFTQKNAPNNLGFTVIGGYTNLAALQQGLISNSPVTTSGPGNTGGSSDTLFLGSFTLTAGPNTGVTPLAVTIQANLRNTAVTNNFMDANFTAMDSQISAASANFNVVPEPGSLILVGLSATAAIAWRKRRFSRPASIVS